jgi:hypothetical protein
MKVREDWEKLEALAVHLEACAARMRAALAEGGPA